MKSKKKKEKKTINQPEFNMCLFKYFDWLILSSMPMKRESKREKERKNKNRRFADEKKK